MPRIARCAPKGLIYHALNRAVARLPLFQKDADYEAFERVLHEAHEKFPVDIFAYCVMPNHWHFVLRPTTDGQLTAFLRCLAHTHTMRWHAHYRTSGTGGVGVDRAANHGLSRVLIFHLQSHPQPANRWGSQKVGE